MPFSLRSARIDDASRIAELVRAAYQKYVEPLGVPPRPMSDDYTAVIADRSVAVAEHDGELAGVIVLRIDHEGFHIDNVAVHPSHQSAGVGKALLALAESEALQAGFDTINLYTHELMTENQALYARIGYVEYDRRRHSDFHMIYMRKSLT